MHAYTQTPTFKHAQLHTHARTHRERERETGYHMNKTHTDIHMYKPDHTQLPTYTHTHSCLHTHNGVQVVERGDLAVLGRLSCLLRKTRSYAHTLRRDREVRVNAVRDRTVEEVFQGLDSFI